MKEKKKETSIKDHSPEKTDPNQMPGSMFLELQRPGKCERHDIERIMDMETRIYYCELCEKDAAKWKKEYEEREEWKREDKRTRTIEKAIPPRFRSATFENYNIIANSKMFDQEAAVNDVEYFVDKFPTLTGMIFIGNHGTGKTHIACAAIKQLVLQGAFDQYNPDYGVKLTTAAKIFRRIKDSWRRDGDSETKALQDYVGPLLLVIDEIDVRYGSQAELILLTEIINDRYEQMRPTILISNVTIPELEEMISPRIIDRFKEGGSVVVFNWDSYRGKK